MSKHFRLAAVLSLLLSLVSLSAGQTHTAATLEDSNVFQATNTFNFPPVIVGLPNGCLNIASGVIGSTGVACGSGGGGSSLFSSLTAGTNVNSGIFAVSGNTWDYSAALLVKQRLAAGLVTTVNGDIGQDTITGYWHAYKAGDKLLIASTNVGTAGQALLSGGDGTGTFADPVVSGPDSPGVAPTRPPVQVGTFDGTNVQRMSSDSSGRVNVNVNGTVPVSGTFFQATQPVSASSLPLPTGASTAAKQPALGVAGTPSTDVISVQGITSMTALKVDGSGVTQPVSGTVTTTPPANASTNVAQFGGSAVATGTGTGGAGVPRVTVSSDSTVTANAGSGTFGTKDVNDMTGTTPGTAPANTGVVGGIFNSAAPTPTTGQTLPLQLDASGNLKINVASGSAGNGAASNTGSAVPTQASYDGVNVGGTLRGQTAVNPTGSVFAAQTDVTSLNGVSLGSPSSYGTSPGAVSVPGVNAFITNTPTVAQGTAAANTAGWPVTSGGITEATAAWTSATGGNTAVTQTITGYNSVAVFLNQGTTITGGVVTFEGSDTTGFTNAYAIQCTTANGFVVGGTYTLVASTNQAFNCDTTGLNAFRVRLSTVITGSGTVNVGILASSMPNSTDIATGIAQWAGTTLGAPSNFGTTPGAVAAANANSSLFIGTVAAASAASGVQKVGITGNTGAAVDAAGQNAVSPANSLLVGCQFNTSPTTIGTGNMSPEQCDSAGNHLVNLKTAIPAGANVIGALTANQSVNVGQIAGANVVADPCQVNARSTAVISLTTSTQVITGVSAKQTYICYIQFALNGTADNVALVEGTGTVCATGIAGMAGGTTAATGWNLLANGSVTSGTIQNWAFKTATLVDNVCLLVSSAAQVSGVIQYVQQ